MISPAHFEHHIHVEDNAISAVELLSEVSGLSRQQVKQVMQQGAVWLGRNGGTRRLRRVRSKLKAGDELHLYYDEKILSSRTQPAELIKDEGEYSVWYKPKGMLSQGSRWGDHCTINRWVEQHLQPQRSAFIVHRLDRATDGLILIAHKRRTAAALAQLFQERRVIKHYRAWAHGQFPVEQSKQTITTEIDGRSAISHTALIEQQPASDRSLLEIKIETGRKHQIRRHLAGIGFPIIGDRLYGKKGDSEDLQLTCTMITLPSPTNGEIITYSVVKKPQTSKSSGAKLTSR
ncbi:MAG: RluA family pseudouridine synthase [Gammaproteobacteria bacterium]|nr:RluA family pseudouridine synthase [Gammaproteobacteria bacterium]